MVSLVMIFTVHASCVMPLVFFWEVLCFVALLFEQKTRVRPEEKRNLQAGWTISLSGFAACSHPWQKPLELEEGEGNFVMLSLK